MKPVLTIGIAALGLSVAMAALASPASEKELAGVTMASAHKLKVTSAQFGPGGRIPEAQSSYGAGLSPALSWSGAPAGTRSYVVLTEDPDASTPKPFVHWVVFDVPGTAKGLPANGLPAGAKAGLNGSGKPGYRGPHPPADGDHHYHFQVFALDRQLGLAETSDRDAVAAAMRGHVLASGELVGLYKKPGA